MAVSRSSMLWKVPRQIAWRVKISTMFSQEPDIGVKCSVTR